MTEHRKTAPPDSPGVVVLPPLLYLGALLAVLVGRSLWQLPIAGGRSTLWPGLALVAAGGGIAAWGRRTMLAAGTNIRPTLPANVIVTSGPFRFSRNPLYVALTLLFVGLTLLLNTWWGIVALVPVLLLMHFGVVRREERYLERKFGETYRQYRGSVRRYL
jgi:protein-S-isoprenylcysteine O-methyltransferase Ste14